MLCEIEYRQQSDEIFSNAVHWNPGDCFRVRKIAGRPDRIFEWLKKQDDVAAVRIIVRVPERKS